MTCLPTLHKLPAPSLSCLDKIERIFRSASAGAYVIARPGHCVIADSGSAVLAQCGSSVIALAGSRVYSLLGASVTEHAGSKVQKIDETTIECSRHVEAPQSVTNHECTSLSPPERVSESLHQLWLCKLYSSPIECPSKIAPPASCEKFFPRIRKSPFRFSIKALPIGLSSLAS